MLFESLRTELYSLGIRVECTPGKRSYSLGGFVFSESLCPCGSNHVLTLVLPPGKRRSARNVAIAPHAKSTFSTLEHCTVRFHIRFHIREAELTELTLHASVSASASASIFASLRHRVSKPGVSSAFSEGAMWTAPQPARSARPVRHMRPRNEVVDLDSRSVLPSGPVGLVAGFRRRGLVR